MRRALVALLGPVCALAVGCTATIPGRAVVATTVVASSVPPATGTTVFDAPKVEQGVTDVLTGPAPDGYGLTGVTDVACPADQPVTVGSTFQCTLLLDGKPKKVTLTVKSADGLYTVGLPA